MAHSPTTATARAASGTLARAMKLGTSLRFLYPTGPETYQRFKEALLRLEPGGFFERPMGAFDPSEQARNALGSASAAPSPHPFAPGATLARLMALRGTMPVGMVLLAPFYQPIVLAEQIGTLAAFAQAPLLVTLANGGRSQTFDAFG